MNWYEENIEEPLRDLVKLLRDNGFNTTCSCGHLPYPFLTMEWYQDSEITKLYNLLVENKYKNFSIKALWYNYQPGVDLKEGSSKRFIDVTFIIAKSFAKLSDIKN